MQTSNTTFPRFTWVRCECGCGYEGEDEVAQFLIEEALIEGLRTQDQAEQAERELALANAHAIADTHRELNQLLEGGSA